MLTLADGLATAPLQALLAATPAIPTGTAAPIMTRPIPSTGERLPVIGLGTAWKYGTDTPVARAVELDYSLGDRSAEQRLLPAAYELGIATLIDMPLGAGNLFHTVTMNQRPLPDWAG